MPQPTPAFGDTVRMVLAPETEAAGLAGHSGIVYGVTTPSVTGVSVLGGAPDDVALNVYFEARRQDVWLRPDLVTFIDHGAGPEVRIAGAPVTWVRESDGGWLEVPDEPQIGGGGRASWHRDLFARLERWFRRG